MKVIGVMSGSSLDGLDIATVQFEDAAGNWKIVSAETIALPDDISTSLSRITEMTAIEIAKTEYAYSSYIGKAIEQHIETHGTVDLVGIHGHTVLHLPDFQTSWQLLNAGMIASMISVPIVTDFRNQDMALGGQGTPMAVIADRDLFPGYDYYVNLGGIANISYVRDNSWLAYDVCPCNQLLNHYSKQLGHAYDKGGLLAETGAVNKTLLDHLLSDPFIKRQPPKSIDNSWIQKEIIPSIDGIASKPVDILRTITEYISMVITDQVHSSGKILFTGGGSYNTHMMSRIETLAHNYNAECVIPANQIVDYKESLLIAYASILRYQGKPNFIASATGASNSVSGGSVYIAR